MTSVLFRFFLLLYGRTILVLQIWLSIYPSSYSILILHGFFLKNILILNLEEKNLAGQERKKKYSDLTFSQYNHIQNVEEKQLFQHFANLIKIRSAHLFPIFYLFFGPRVRRSNYTLAPRRGTGVYCFTSVCPSFQDIFRRIFLSNY